MSSRLHPGEFSRNIAKWKRAMIAEITQLSRGIRGSDGQYYLPSLVLYTRVPLRPACRCALRAISSSAIYAIFGS